MPVLTVAEDMSAIFTAATSVLTWLLSAAGSVYDFIISNPLALIFVGISLGFVAFNVIRRVIGR